MRAEALIEAFAAARQISVGAEGVGRVLRAVRAWVLHSTWHFRSTMGCWKSATDARRLPTKHDGGGRSNLRTQIGRWRRAALGSCCHSKGTCTSASLSKARTGLPKTQAQSCREQSALTYQGDHCRKAGRDHRAWASAGSGLGLQRNESDRGCVMEGERTEPISSGAALSKSLRGCCCGTARQTALNAHRRAKDLSVCRTAF